MLTTTDFKITMSSQEFADFQSATFAPWVPRTVAEFNAMCDLGSARHLAENTGGQGFMHAIAAEGMRYGENGQANFPIDRRRMAYAKVHGTWPTDGQLKDFEGRRTVPALALAASNPSSDSPETDAMLSGARCIVLGGNWYALHAGQLLTGPVKADATHNLTEWSQVNWDRLDPESRGQCLRAKTVLVGGKD
jgi:hypothetical protein